MTKTQSETQNDMLIGIHDAIVDDPFFQGESILRHEIVEILAAVLDAQYDRRCNDDEKQHTD